MILDIEIFKNQGPIKEATLVPLVFPFASRSGSFTTLLSLSCAEYASVNIIVALILNMLWVYFVVRMTRKVERILGKGGIYLIRKFFGIILLAISVKLFMSNITLLNGTDRGEYESNIGFPLEKSIQFHPIETKSSLG